MRTRAASLLGAMALAGCSGWQSALEVHGPQAAGIRDLFTIFTLVCAAVWLLVALSLGYALARRRSATVADPLALPEATERRAERAITGLVLLTAAILVALTVLSFATGRGLAALQGREDALSIRLTGHQWWWEVQYQDPSPSQVLTTANEIHIPVGRPVRLVLTSGDVIHSFWVPNLHGKRDLITGRDNEIWLQADRPGSYRGQCAEYCGAQHARMALLVVAHEPAAFQAWRDAQLQPATPPEEEEARQGQRVFETRACAMCHAIRGTAANGRVAPDLTHIASRETIAAGTLPMTRGALGAWIADPQAVKPGNNMPLVPLEPAEFQALLGYLMGLR
jgi:cytochrome c oxidase subunit 2